MALPIRIFLAESGCIEGSTNKTICSLVTDGILLITSIVLGILAAMGTLPVGVTGTFGVTGAIILLYIALTINCCRHRLSRTVANEYVPLDQEEGLPLPDSDSDYYPQVNIDDLDPMGLVQEQF